MIPVEDPTFARYLKKLGYKWDEVRSIGTFNDKPLWCFIFKDKPRIRQLKLMWEEAILRI